MVLADWTCSGIGTCILDASIKQVGNSAVKINTPPNTAGSTLLTHDTFLEMQAQVIAWARMFTEGDYAKPMINLSGYGDADLYPYMIEETWAKFKVSFWYDISSDTKWCRIEKWIDSAWVLQGNDDNMGAGSPASGTLALKIYSSSTYSGYVWFDEVEVSA